MVRILVAVRPGAGTETSSYAVGDKGPSSSGSNPRSNVLTGSCTSYLVFLGLENAIRKVWLVLLRKMILRSLSMGARSKFAPFDCVVWISWTFAISACKEQIVSPSWDFSLSMRLRQFVCIISPQLYVAFEVSFRSEDQWMAMSGLWSSNESYKERLLENQKCQPSSAVTSDGQCVLKYMFHG